MSEDHEHDELEIDELPEETDDYEDTDLEDKLFSDHLEDKLDDGPEGVPSVMGMQEPVYAQPVNRATMVCLRGECIHYWALTARYTTVGKDIRLKRIRQCNCHYEETSLGGANIYHCTKWWPVWLDWMPSFMRGSLRPVLYRAYDKVLRLLKYDFSWKTWRDDVFESDRREFRIDSGPGGKRALSKEE